MPVFRLSDALVFPPARLAASGGLLAVGGDLAPERVLLAYAGGIFPWPHEGYELLWFSPELRMVLRPPRLHVSRRLARTIRRRRFDVRFDHACRDVIAHCASVARRDGPGTWITPEMIAAYGALHDAGYVHSAEAWRGGRLVGGLYGVSLGGVFVGESMFTLESDASKVALVALVRQIERWCFDLFDAQVHTPHVAHFGAREWPRSRYLQVLRRALERPTRRGTWRLDDDLA